MLLLLLVAGSALPSNSLPMQEQTHHLPQTPSPRLVVLSYNQSHNQSHNQSIQTYRHLTQALSGKKAMIPTPSKKVEQFAAKLRDDIEAQERVLQTYISTLQTKHDRVKKNLKQFKAIIADLRRQIANATEYEQKYISEDSVVSDEFSKSQKMYKDEASNLKFEKAFLEEIIKYIQLRKTQKCWVFYLRLMWREPLRPPSSTHCKCLTQQNTPA